MSVLFLLTHWLSCSLPGLAGEAQLGQPDLSCHIGAADGARRYRQGRWGIVEVLVTNRTNRTTEAESVVWFLDDPTLQFSRRVVVPPNATLKTTCPIRIPALADPAARHVEFLSQQVLPAPRGQSTKSPQERKLASQPLILDPEVPAIGLMCDMEHVLPPTKPGSYHAVDPVQPLEPDQLVYEMLVAAKVASGMSRRVSVFDAKDLPPDPAVLDVLDLLVLSTDRLASDVGGQLAVRDWVLGGGHLWILLDEVRPETVSALLGDAFTTVCVDHVNLTHLSLLDAQLDPALQSPVEFERERPVELIRVIPDGATVMKTVNGWPAAFWQPIGAGRVYFTTLSAEAWLRRATAEDARMTSSRDLGSYYPTVPLIDFLEHCIGERHEADVHPREMEPYLSQQIGYRIVSRSAVTTLLGSFFAASMLAGAWLYRKGRPEHLLWVVPLSVAITSIVFVSVALGTRKSVPPTVATAARVALEPGVAAAHSWGLVAMYNPEASRKSIGAAQGGMFFPDMTGLTGERRRIVWTDDGTWHWSSLELPAGVRTAAFERPLPLPAAVDCRAQFDAHGLVGTLGPHPFANLRDAVITLPYGPRLAATIRDGNSFTARAQDVLAEGEYSVESWRSDVQLRRKAVYDHLFAKPPETGVRLDPVLYAWSDRVETGFEFTHPRQLHSTLLSTRILLMPTAPGTPVRIPAPCLPYRAVPDPDGRPPSAYNNTVHRWVENKFAVTEWLRFQMPSQVLPLHVERATIRFTIRAASRSLQVSGVKAGQLVPLLFLSRPIGSYSVVVDRQDLLQLDPAGGLLFVVTVGDQQTGQPDDQMSQVAWKMESFQLEVAGTVQLPNEN